MNGMPDGSSFEGAALKDRLEAYVDRPAVLGFTVDDVVLAGRRDLRRRHARLLAAAAVAVVGSAFGLVAAHPWSGADGRPTAPTSSPSASSSERFESSASEMPKVLTGLAAVTFPGTAESRVSARTWTYEPSAERVDLPPDQQASASDWLLTMHDGPMVDGSPEYTFMLGSRYVPPDWDARLWLSTFCSAEERSTRCSVDLVNGGWELSFDSTTSRRLAVPGEGSDAAGDHQTRGYYRLVDGLLTFAEAQVRNGPGDPGGATWPVTSRSLRDAVRDLGLRFVMPDPAPGLPSVELCAWQIDSCQS
ncbi:MAG: hypothetical protein U0R78_08720 [Nocardioidaceae bacterium]